MTRRRRGVAALALLVASCAVSTPRASPEDAGTADAGGDDGPWRSALYPVEWTPAFTADGGLFLHDFSYAGYRGGEADPPTAPPGSRFDVTAFGADPDGGADATSAIQAAVDAAGTDGGTVYFPEGLYRVDGLLRVERSFVVLRGEGPARSRLRFTATVGSHPALDYGAHLSIGMQPSLGEEFGLAVDGRSRSATVEVADAGTLAPGDEVALGWTVTSAFVAEHGMAGLWDVPAFSFYGTWQPFAWRTVVSVDTRSSPHRVLLDVPLRMAARVRDGASLRRVSGRVTEVGVEGLGLANACDEDAAWAGNQVHVLRLQGVKDGWVRDVASFSPSGTGGPHLQSSGLLLLGARRVTVEQVALSDVQNRGGGGNGYLFEVRQSNEVLTRDCTGLRGRHNFIQNWEFGTSGCVWLDVRSEGGLGKESQSSPTSYVALSETHRALAHANLFDRSDFRDGLALVNRGRQSTNAGNTASESVAWNCSGGGTGVLRSYQDGVGYVVGAHGFEAVSTALDDVGALLSGWATGTAPADVVEDAPGRVLEPSSLYLDQRSRRLGR